MSSSGITPINSGPLILRTYLNSSSNNTYAVGAYDDPVPENRVLVTSTGGLVVPSDTISVSTLFISTLTGPPANDWSDYLFWNNTATPPSWQVGSTQIHLGSNAGEMNQGIRAIAIGNEAGNDTQGDNAIAIGFQAGQLNQAPSSIVINATGSVLQNTTQGTCKVAPIRGPTIAPNVLYYDDSSKEVVYGSSWAYGSWGKISGTPQVVTAGNTVLLLPSQLITPKNITGTLSAGSYTIQIIQSGTYRVSLGVSWDNPTGAVNYLAHTFLRINGNPTGDHGQCGGASATPNYSTTYHLFSEWFISLSVSDTVGAEINITGAGNYNVIRTILNIQQIG